MIYQRGKRHTYWYRFRFGGRIIHESARTTSKTLAVGAERQRRRELERQWNRIEKHSLPPRFAEAAKCWLENRRHYVASNTLETYGHAIKHLNGILGGVLVCDVDVAHYQQVRKAKGLAAATVNKEVSCLISILKECGIWQALRRPVKMLKEPESAGRALLPDQEILLVKAASALGQHQGWWSPIYVVTLLGLNTGLRHSEIRQLRWEEVDLSNRLLRVARSKTEAGTGRFVPLNRPAWAALEMWASRFPNSGPNDFVFPACENGHVDASRPVSNWRTAWKHICQRAGLLGLRFHDLRHTAATKLLESGVPFAVVAQLLGWSPATAIRMSKRYGHIRPEAQRRAMDAIASVQCQTGVHQLDNQVRGLVESSPGNSLKPLQ